MTDLGPARLSSRGLASPAVDCIQRTQHRIVRVTRAVHVYSRAKTAGRSWSLGQPNNNRGMVFFLYKKAFVNADNELTVDGTLL